MILSHVMVWAVCLHRVLDKRCSPGDSHLAAFGLECAPIYQVNGIITQHLCANACLTD